MVAAARRVAYQILLQMERPEAHSDELLRSPEVDALSPRDRNLTTMLVLGTLRWQLALDAQIRMWLARPQAKLGAEVAAALRMGAFQLLHLERVPAHAVIHDSVELIKHSGERGAAGMVNAVLRKISGNAQVSGSTAVRASDSEAAARQAHPVWLVRRWVRRYGMETAEAICQWDQEPAPLTLRGPARLEGVETGPGAFLAGARRVLRGDIGGSGELRAGRIRIQDEASQLVAEIAAAAAPQAERALDTCAAPGAKTAILRERLPNAEITALDVSRRRVQAARALPGPAPIRWEVADAAQLQLQPEYDLILADVPCSGTGTLARNPEIRLRLEETDLTRQHARQVAILRAALAGLKTGGRLVYSTCSLEPEENEEVIDEVLRAMPGFHLLQVETVLDALASRGVVTAEGRERLRSATDAAFLRTLPGVHRCDGFFAAVVERT